MKILCKCSTLSIGSEFDSVRSLIDVSKSPSTILISDTSLAKALTSSGAANNGLSFAKSPDRRSPAWKSAIMLAVIDNGSIFDEIKIDASTFKLYYDILSPVHIIEGRSERVRLAEAAIFDTSQGRFRCLAPIK